MRVLFVSPNPLCHDRGASKVLLELAEEMSPLGWQCQFIEPQTLHLPWPTTRSLRRVFAARVGEHLEEVAGNYDVVDYDHGYLPFPRDRFCATTLFVARSALLPHHEERVRVPVPWSLRSTAGRWWHGRSRRQERDEALKMATMALEEADLINVNNDMDKDELVRRGIAAGKVVVIELGINRRRRELFDAVPGRVPELPVVVFVGSFDWRKGAADFPSLVGAVARAVPGVRFRLLGTAGLFPTAQAVLSRFPRRLWPLLEIVPRFAADDLPALLGGCSVGVFPSYWEGFGLGVLEMLAASVPVVAYDVPGPPMMLPPDYLVARGDVAAMAARVVGLLRGTDDLRRARHWARERSRDFDLGRVAAKTAGAYQQALASLRGSKKRSSQLVGGHP